MLFLLLHIGQERYVIEASRIVEVLPLVAVTRLAQAPKGFAGMINYRGQAVPAIDLCELASGSAAGERLSTRIIIVRFQDADQQERFLGLIAEQVTQMLRKNPAEFVQAGCHHSGA